MFKKCNPEQVGISSVHIMNFINEIENSHISLHDFIIIKDGYNVAEGYYKPFNKDFHHRLYSSTKSFVSMSIGLLADKGLISLDDKIIKFFPDLIEKDKLHPYLEKTTVKNLLMMSTPYSKSTYGFPEPYGYEWLKSYFVSQPDHPAGTMFYYDSCGSYVLGAIVKRVTGKNFYEYLKEEVLYDLGFSENSYCLEGPDGEAWAGSGILATLNELAIFAYLMLNKGKLNGKQYISKKYVTEATTRQIDNDTYNDETPWHCGYGYQFWILKDNAFATLGMGGQVSICVPDKNLVFAFNAYTDPHHYGYFEIFDIFWREILNKIDSNILPENIAEHNKLQNKLKNLELNSYINNVEDNISKEIDGNSYKISENSIGLSHIKININDKEGTLEFVKNGETKNISFGIGTNKIATFPEKKYHGDRLGTSANREYSTAFSGGWVEKDKLVIKCQIIDKYFGAVKITLSFKDDVISVSMHKHGQFILDDYQGYAGGVKTDTD